MREKTPCERCVVQKVVEDAPNKMREKPKPGETSNLRPELTTSGELKN